MKIKLALLTPTILLAGCASWSEFVETLSTDLPPLADRVPEAAANGVAGWLGLGSVALTTVIGACFKKTRPATLGLIKTVSTLGLNHLSAWLKRRGLNK